MDEIVNVAGINRRGILAFIDHFLHLLVLLLESSDVPINRGLKIKKKVERKGKSDLRGVP